MTMKFFKGLFGSKQVLLQQMQEFKFYEGDSAKLESEFNKWATAQSEKYKGFKVLSFNVETSRDAGNRFVKTIYVLFEHE